MIEQHEPPTFHKRVPLPPRRRMNLVVTSEQLATLLNLPPDVTVAAFTLDNLRDSVIFALAGERFDVIPPGVEARSLVAELEIVSGEDGALTQRVTWEGIEGAEVTTRIGGDTYRSRTATVRARQWLGVEGHIRELCPDFYELEETDRATCDDPDATGHVMTAPNSVWTLVYDGDWIVRRGGGWVRMTDEEFVAEFEPVTA